MVALNSMMHLLVPEAKERITLCKQLQIHSPGIARLTRVRPQEARLRSVLAPDTLSPRVASSPHFDLNTPRDVENSRAAVTPYPFKSAERPTWHQAPKKTPTPKHRPNRTEQNRRLRAQSQLAIQQLYFQTRYQDWYGDRD